jgi:hypothetical protein
MLGIMPIFTLEEGRLSSVEKVRNNRALSDFMQEFICEFDAFDQIALVQSNPGMVHEARLLREHAQSYFPQTPFSELTISPPLATLIGPRSMGLVVVEITLRMSFPRTHRRIFVEWLPGSTPLEYVFASPYKFSSLHNFAVKLQYAVFR